MLTTGLSLEYLDSDFGTMSAANGRSMAIVELGGGTLQPLKAFLLQFIGNASKVVGFGHRKSDINTASKDTILTIDTASIVNGYLLRLGD